ncbi:MAG TPA: STAS/SEC14 domain-containing protein [Sphingomicrobium sp.]|jgi:hypothetical protein
MFTITHQPATNVIAVTVSGFFDLEGFERYATEVEPIIHRAAQIGEGYLMLLDISGCSIQTQEIAAAVQRHLANVPRARFCAVVTGASPARMQARRMIGSPTIQIFEESASALSWLINSKLGKAAA